MKDSKTGKFRTNLLLSVSLAFLVFMLAVSVSTVAMAASLLVKQGSRGEDVKKVQIRLIEKGFLKGEADGICGKQTVAAIKAFQKANNLQVDGVCGMLTYHVLDPEDAAAVAAAPDKKKTYINYDKGSANYRLDHPVWVEATAYSAEDPGNGHYTATGTLVRHGVIAVDPGFIGLGTRVYIPGYGEAVAEDIGGAIKGNVIDVAFDTHEEAMMFGRRSLEIFILD